MFEFYQGLRQPPSAVTRKDPGTEVASFIDHEIIILTNLNK